MFGGDANFSHACFDGDAMFHNAAFQGECSFQEAAFAAGATFWKATFRDRTSFADATIGGRADFGHAGFDDMASFDGVTFAGEPLCAIFDNTDFASYAWFQRSRFESRGVFADAVFWDSADFHHATVADLDLARATVRREISFRNAAFACRDFGPLLVVGTCDLSQSEFVRPVRVEVSCAALVVDGAVFRGGVDILVDRADASFDRVDFAEASLITPATSGAGNGGTELTSCVVQVDGIWRCYPGVEDTTTTARIVSLRQAKVQRVTISNLDLRACRFVGAHGLDGLRIERTLLAQPPELRQGSRKRWTRRQTVAEEHVWRHAREPRSNWYAVGSAVRAPDWLSDADAVLAASQVAEIYQALRSGREKVSDQAGAADFYYGEMEMRRHRAAAARGDAEGDAPGSPSQRVVLWLYWLTAGYGLRASRALACLIVTVVCLAVPLSLWGFTHDRDYWAALLFAVESSISLLRAPSVALTDTGQIATIVLRLAGPLFFGLALVSVRGRVKR